MGNPNKAKGTRAETRVVKFLESYGIKARRKALSGSKDEGDIEIPDWDICLEVKAGKQTANYSRKQLEEWLRQSHEEEINSNQICYLVIVRYQRDTKNAEVWHKVHGSDASLFQYLDSWCEEQMVEVKQSKKANKRKGN